MSGKAIAVAEAESGDGEVLTLQLFEDRTGRCSCGEFGTKGACDHLRAQFKAWVAEGLVPGVKAGNGAPAPAAAPTAPAAAKPTWRAATESEAKRWKFASSKPGAKTPLPDYVRKIATGQREVNEKDGQEYPVMRVEILVGSPADTQGGAAAAPPAASNGTAIAAKPKGAAPAALSYGDQKLQDLRTLREDDFYRVGKWKDGSPKIAPNARALNLWADQNEISTELVRDAQGRPVSGADATKAWAAVRGRKGKETREAQVTIVFSLEFPQLVWDFIDRKKRDAPDWDGYAFDEDSGQPVLKAEDDRIHITRQFLRLRRFAERIARTKAEAIVQKLLLGIEHREDDETAFERREVDDVRAATAGVGTSAPERSASAEDLASGFGD